MPWDYLTDRPAPTGLAQLAPLIRAARATAVNVLLVDNGDFLQGSPLGDWQDRHGTGPHPMVAAMNALGYDAGTLGNHEFSHGLAFLVSALSEVGFPVVSANLTRNDGVPLVPAHATLTRRVTDTTGATHDLRIAVTGFAPPQTAKWEALRLNGSLDAADILTAAEHTLARIAAEAPDLTLALAHTGIGAATPAPDMENAAVPLALDPRIDVLVTGHTHLAFPYGADADSPPSVGPDPAVNAANGSLHGKPAVMAGFHGSHLGVIDLTLHQSGGRWRVVAHRSTLLPAPTDPCADPVLEQLAQPAHQATRDLMRHPLGTTTAPLHSHFALIAPDATVHLVAQAQIAHWRDCMPAHLSGLPLLAAVAPFRTGGRGGPQNVTDIPPGPILNRHVADLYAHPNTPVLLCLTKADIEDWLERAVILFNHIVPGSSDTPLLRADIPGFDFDLIDGLSFAVDPSQPPRFDARGTLVDPAARRITGLRLHGQPLDPAGRFLLATNSYRAGSGIFAGTTRPPVARSDTPIRDLVARHIAGAAMLTPTAPESWALAALPDTTVTVDLSPAASRHIDHIARFRPHALGITPSGFQRFRLSL